MAKNFVIVNQTKPTDDEYAEELVRMLPKCAYYNGDNGWQSSPFNGSEEAFAMALDTALYALNNFVKSKLYDNIVFTWYLPDSQYIDDFFKHLKAGDYFVTFFNLVDLSRKEEVYQQGAERLNEVEYYRLYNNAHPVKLCHLDIGKLEDIEIVKMLYDHIQADKPEEEKQ